MRPEWDQLGNQSTGQGPALPPPAGPGWGPGRGPGWNPGQDQGAPWPGKDYSWARHIHPLTQLRQEGEAPWQRSNRAPELRGVGETPVPSPHLGHGEPCHPWSLLLQQGGTAEWQRPEGIPCPHHPCLDPLQLHLGPGAWSNGQGSAQYSIFFWMLTVGVNNDRKGEAKKCHLNFELN